MTRHRFLSRRAPDGGRASLAVALATALAAAGLAGCSHLPFSPPPPATPAEPPVLAPLYLEGGLPVVEARLPGDVRAWFLIDTGAGKFTLLDASLSAALALKHELVRDPLMPSISYSARLPFLEVDSMGRRDMTAYIADGLAGRSELAELGVPVQGVLGTHYFRGHCLWIDWGRREFTAMWPRVRHARHVALPLRFGVGGELHATVRINGIFCDALIDTGSAETVLSTETADRLQIRYDAGKLGLHRETAIGLGAVRDGTLQRLALGTEELNDVAVLVVERRIPNADLILGTDVLSHWGTILDFGERPYLVLDPLQGKADPAAREHLPTPEAAAPGEAAAPAPPAAPATP
ncbi:MAG: hypothetical protein FJ293_16070, partial [Planctomycetes bacterium]|nr:hypothetical protein [Planctomycetota bacterium]